MRNLAWTFAVLMTASGSLQAQIQWGNDPSQPQGGFGRPAQPAGKAATREAAPAELPASKAPFARPSAAQKAISQQANAPQPQIDACTGKPPTAPLRAFTSRSAVAAAVSSGQLNIKGSNPYPGSGSGPVPLITDWSPRGRIGKGTELRVQGRDLVPGQVVAMIGASVLTPTTQSPGDIKFRADDITAGALVVYNKNGQPRMLEEKYSVFDPTVVVSKVVPATFGVGDTVTVCGSSLFQAILGQMASSVRYDNAPNYADVQLSPGNFIGIADRWISVDNVSVSPSGDRLVFTAGAAYRDMPACNQTASCSSPQGISWFLAPVAVSSLSGPMKLGVAGTPGPNLNWQSVGVQGPTISSAYGLTFDQASFVIIQDSSSPGYNATDRVVEAQGTHLENATWRIGNTPIPSVVSNAPTLARVNLPSNVVTGPLCATKNGQTACSSPIQVLSGPVVSRAPAMPLALRTSYTIDGANLKPAGVAGLSYVFTGPFMNTTGCSMPGRPYYNGTMGADWQTCENIRCNRDLQIVQHTDQKIVFRFGDPAKPTPTTCSLDASLLQASPSNKLGLYPTYNGKNGNWMWSASYYLKATP